MFRFFVVMIALILVLTDMSTVMAESEVNEVVELRKEVIQLRNQIDKIRNDEMSIERIDTIVFKSLVSEFAFDETALAGNFIYHRPIVWAKVAQEGIYSHRDTILFLGDSVKESAVIFNGRLIGIKDGFLVSTQCPDPVETIMTYKGLFPEVHDERTKPLLETEGASVPIDGMETVSGDLSDHVLHRLFGFRPRTDYDIVIKLGDTIAGIRFSAGQRRWMYHREARLMLVGGGGVSLHGYPGSLPEGIDYKNAAHASTDALGYLLIAEIMRDIAFLTYRVEWFEASEGFGAPSAHSADFSAVTSLARKAERLFFGVGPKGKQITTWGAIKSRR